MMRRQIYIEEAQDKRLAEVAVLKGVSKSEIIRKAIDHELIRSPVSTDEWRKSMLELAGSWPDAPDGKEYVEQIRDGSWIKRIDRLFESSQS